MFTTDYLPSRSYLRILLALVAWRAGLPGALSSLTWYELMYVRSVWLEIEAARRREDFLDELAQKRAERFRQARSRWLRENGQDA